MSKMRLILVDKRELFREGLAKLLNNETSFIVLCTCNSSQETIDKVKELDPDVVVLDSELPEGETVKLTEHISELFPRTKVIILGHSVDSNNLFSCIRAGAQGYLTKDMSLEDLIKAITLATNGEIVLEATIARKAFETSTVERNRKRQDMDILSMREREVMGLIIKGATNKEIADTLFISEYTVKVHIHSILSKCHIRNRKQAMALAITGDENSILATSQEKSEGSWL